MTIKYEALVGHLFVVGGRPISTQPPGARIQIPPRRAHRSREQDTLFVLITPAGKSTPKATFFEELANLACNVYFKSRLGVTGALREAANALNTHIQQLNSQQASDLRAGALLLVKRTDDVYIMRVGTTVCVAQRLQGYETFPADPDLLNILPLGARSEPMVEFTHYSLSPNDMLLLGDAGVAAMSDDMLKKALKTGDISAALEILESGVERQAFATMIQFVDADADIQKVPAIDPPVETDDDVIEANEPEIIAVVMESAPTDEKTPVVDVAPSVVEPVPPTDDESIAEDGTSKQDKVVTEADEALSTTDDESADESVDATPAAASPEKAPRKRQSLPRVIFAGILLLLATILRSLANGINAILDRLLPEPEEGARSSQLVPMNLVAVVAVFVPAVVAIVVVGLAINTDQESSFEAARQVALEARDTAMSIENDPTATNRDKRNGWIEVRTWAQNALNEYNESTEMRQLLLDAQNYINSYDRIEPTEVTELRTFADNARLIGPILSESGQDIYTLDRNRSQIFRDSLDGNGTSVVESQEVSIIELGRRINEYLVASLVDIEWITTPGAVQQNALIALDDNGLLISYNANFGVGALQLALPPEWQRPEAIALWDVNLYVLDAGGNQIWRYRPENGLFQNPPEEYFTGNNRPDLGAAVDFGIEEEGDIFILFNDGTISRYRGGDPVNFSLNEAAAPVDGINNGVALYVNNARQDYALYVADQENDTVYKISLGGTVRGGYRPSNLLSDDFDDVSGVYDDPARGNIYILAGNKLFRASRIVD